MAAELFGISWMLGKSRDASHQEFPAILLARPGTRASLVDYHRRWLHRSTGFGRA